MELTRDDSTSPAKIKRQLAARLINLDALCTCLDTCLYAPGSSAVFQSQIRDSSTPLS